MLLAQSVGLAKEREAGERGVIARLMPRVLAALVILAIGASCFRVVPAGQVGVLERLGSPVGSFDAEGKAVPVLRQPGLHVSMPWPIDTMVLIPTAELQYTDVGQQLHTTNGGENLDFQFWTIGNEIPKQGVEKEDEFATGDTTLNQEGQPVASPQLLETYVGVWWRVADPVKFYNDLSHSDFYEKAEGGTTALPIYAALVQQTAAYAVTRTFAIHPLEKLLITERAETNEHCRQILQDKLDEAGSGIEIVDLTIKDLHPPFGGGVQDDFRAPGGKRLGPAHAFEKVVAMREYREMRIDRAKAQALGATNRAKGDAASTISHAQARRAETIGAAQGEAARLSTMMGEISASPDAAALTELAELRTLYAAMQETIVGPAKVLVDPSVKVNVWQTTKEGATPMRPAPQ
jgi:regulator of protease activity HflC (stomatin/prohibitin superfamily)